MSTTHTITGAIVGVGTVRKLSAIRWGGAAANIGWAWVFTVPGTAFIGAGAFLLADVMTSRRFATCHPA